MIGDICFIYYDAYSYMITSAFMVNGTRCGNVDAGVSEEVSNDMLDIVEEEIIPELEEICEKYNKPMPQEFRYIYNVKSGAFDTDYRYEKDINEIPEYDPGIAAQEWMQSLFEEELDDRRKL